MVANVTYKVDISDAVEFLDSRPTFIRDAIKPDVRWAGLQTRKAAKRMIDQSPRGGIHWPGLPFRSSAPGEAPGSQSGRLRQSITFRTARNGMSQVVQAGAFYAGYLEGGTSRMAARPFMIPAMEEVFPEFEQRIQRTLDGA